MTNLQARFIFGLFATLIGQSNCVIPIDMKLTNDSFVILINTKTATERYYRDKIGWLKESTRGRKFRATAEQVLNHILPVLAGIKPSLTVEVEYHRTDSSREIA